MAFPYLRTTFEAASFDDDLRLCFKRRMQVPMYSILCPQPPFLLPLNSLQRRRGSRASDMRLVVRVVDTLYLILDVHSSTGLGTSECDHGRRSLPKLAPHISHLKFRDACPLLLLQE